MKTRSTLLAGAALALFTSLAFADDNYPPSWRGDVGSTFQRWEFLAPDPEAMPDVEDNPYGDPLGLVAGHNWTAVDVSGRQGVWSLSGVMAFYLPNTPWDYDKRLQIQVTWRPTSDPTSEPLLGVVSNVGEVCDLLLLSTDALPNDWYLSRYQGCIRPNPPHEVVGITGNIDVDQVVIDTWCPEPKAYALLSGLGLLGFGVWRRLHS
jgi:hypothetical protein